MLSSELLLNGLSFSPFRGYFGQVLISPVFDCGFQKGAIGTNLAWRCLAKKKDGSFCLELLDADGLHACVCRAEGSNIHRHDTIRDGLVPALKPIFTCVKIEQFIFELAEMDDDTRQTKEAPMNIVTDTVLDSKILMTRPRTPTNVNP